MSIIDKIDEWADYSEVELQLVGGDKEEIEKYAPAIVGVTDGHWTTSEYNDRVAVVYDEAKMIEIIAKDMEPVGDPNDPYNDPYFMADEHFSFNIKGSWVGEHTPIFINTFSSATQVSSFPPNLRDPDSEEAMIREDLYLAAQTKATEQGISLGKFLEEALELTLKIESLTEDQFEELFYNGKSPKDGFTMSTGEVSQGAGRMGYLATSLGSMRPHSHLGGFDDAEGREEKVSVYEEGQGGSGGVSEEGKAG